MKMLIPTVYAYSELRKDSMGEMHTISRKDRTHFSVEVMPKEDLTLVAEMQYNPIDSLMGFLYYREETGQFFSAGLDRIRHWNTSMTDLMTACAPVSLHRTTNYREQHHIASEGLTQSLHAIVKGELLTDTRSDKLGFIRDYAKHMALYEGRVLIEVHEPRIDLDYLSGIPISLHITRKGTEQRSHGHKLYPLTEMSEAILDYKTIQPDKPASVGFWLKIHRPEVFTPVAWQVQQQEEKTQAPSPL